MQKRLHHSEVKKEKKEIIKMASPRVGSCMWINEPIIRARQHKHPKWPELFRLNKGGDQVSDKQSPSRACAEEGSMDMKPSRSAF
jgi:hypothetical protein